MKKSIRSNFSNGTVGETQYPVKVKKVDETQTIVDFGRDAFGWLEIKGPKTQNISVRLGEKLQDDGRIDMNPGGTIRSAGITAIQEDADNWTRVPLTADVRNTTGTNQKAIAIRLPEEVGVIMPFRYAEIPEGFEARRVVVWWPMEQKVQWSAKDVAGITADQKSDLDRLFDFSAYSIKATSFCGLYVDGDRERIPYEGDIYINMLGQLYGVDGDPELARKTIRHVLKYPTWPTEWKQYAILCVWQDWKYTGDTKLAAECYEQLRNEKLMLERAREDFLLPAVDGEDIVDWPKGERDGYEMAVMANTVVNAFHYANLLEMADLANALGKIDDATFFKDRATKVKDSFNDVLFDKEQGLYVDGDTSRHASFHANVAALYFGLVPAERVTKPLDFILKKGMVCSPYFAQLYLETLFKYNRRDDAIRLLTDKGPRSWLGMLEQGSTITMEAWSLEAKPNQDWNHAWGAAPANLLPRFL